ncbi:MAG: DUF4011 domain-containing protein [Betaproteobacteria bacterium]|nr:DUF4011 domain-containing protein [Betaproteobacteria bacterium]
MARILDLIGMVDQRHVQNLGRDEYKPEVHDIAGLCDVGHGKTGVTGLSLGIQSQSSDFRNKFCAKGSNVPGEDRTTVYEVLDHAASGIRLQVEFQRRVNASLLASRLPFIRAITIHNETGSDLPGIELSAGLAVESDVPHWFACREDKGIPSGSAVRFNGGRFPELDALIEERHESALATLTITAHLPQAEAQGEEKQDKDSREVSLAATVEIGAPGEFLKLPGAWQSIAVFVQPRSKAVAEILHVASELMLQKTKRGELDGYKGGLTRAKLIAEAIYLAMREEQIVCAGSPASFEAVGQKLRTAGQVIGQRFGDCIELSVTYAACCETAGLHPIVIFTTSRAFPAFIAVSELEYSLALGSGEGFNFLEETVIDDASVIANLVAMKTIIPVELGGIGSGKRSLSFRGATKKAADYVRSLSNELKAAVAISQCRRKGILPGSLAEDELPSLGEGTVAEGGLPPESPHGGESPQEPVKADENESFSEESGELAPAATTEPLVAEALITEIPATEISATKALATSPTIEEPADGEVAVSVSTGRKDDAPTRIRQWQQSLFDFSLRNPLLDLSRTQQVLELAVKGHALGGIAETLHAGKISTAVFEGLEPARTAARLRALKRESEMLGQETGSHHLYLTLGVLAHPSIRGKTAKSPLFLLPVTVGAGDTGTSEKNTFTISLVGGEVAQANPCLLEWLRVTYNLTLDGLDNPGFDGAGSTLDAVFEKIRVSLMVAQLPWSVEEHASLAILKCSAFQMWKDLDRNWPILMENSVVRHLVEHSGDVFEQVALDDIPFEEENLILPLAADGSQMAAIAAAMDGKSFVLEGAPGTGKSQTIANLIAHGLEMGKRVLFVSGKEAALEAVSQRLETIGLKDFTLEAYGAGMSMQDIRQQLKRSMRAAADAHERVWKAAFDKYAGTVAALRDYSTRLHTPNAAGFSLWSAYDELTRLGEGPGWGLNPKHVRKINAQAMLDALDRAVQISQKIGGPERDHWLLLGLDSVDNLTFTTLTSALEGLAVVRKRVQELARGWSGAFRELKPGKMLATLNECVAANQFGLLPSKAYFRDIDRPAWRSATTALREKLEFFLTSNQEALLMLAPGLIDSPKLNDWTIQATNLAKARLFAEFRRKSIRIAVEPLVQSDVDLGGHNLLDVLQSAQNIRTQVAELKTHAVAIVGLILPANWAAHRPRALEELDNAIKLSQDAVWLERVAPVAWLKALEPKDAQEIGALKEIEAAWSRWLSIVGATEHSVDQWLAGRAWLEAWDEAMPRWENDLAGTGLLQLQRHALLRKELRTIERAGGIDFANKLAHRTFSLDEAETVMRRGLALGSLHERLTACGMENFDDAAQDKMVSAFLESAREVRKFAIQAGPARLLARRPFRANNILGEVTALVRQIERRRTGMGLREISARYPEALLTFAPAFLMSPGSVAHILDAGALKFDMVIFDESSRIGTVEAIGAMGRGRTVVIVGDTKQLPPATAVGASSPSKRFGSAAISGAEQESILSAALNSGLSRLRLKWHYRSENEELITFSNIRYYGGELAILPSAWCNAHAGITWRRLDGKFLRGVDETNPIEARALVDELTARLRDPAKRDESLGVLCLNAAQRDLILDMLEELGEPLVRDAFAAPVGRRLFVKSFEHAQGEERDVILVSLVLSPDPATGYLPLDCGPLSFGGGERWLNVAITRARKQVRLLASFGPENIGPEHEIYAGVKDLRDYLVFAASPSETMPEAPIPEEGRGSLALEIAKALEARGYVVQTRVGHSAFRVDLAVKKTNEKGWRLAIMLDGPGWKSQLTVMDRDGAPPLLRDAMHWPAVTRVWLPAWLQDREGQLARLIDLVESPLSSKLPS